MRKTTDSKERNRAWWQTWLWAWTLVGVLFAGAGPGRAQVKARLLTQDEIANVRVRLQLSADARIAGPLQVDAAQSFAVEGTGFAGFTLVPVRFESHDEAGSGTSYRCGVFVVMGAGAAGFLRTVGYDWTETVRCDGLDGLGFVADARGRTAPQILLLYSAASPNASVKEPVVLQWSSASGRYAANERLSRFLEDDAKALSIAGMKRFLRSYKGSGRTK
jgi:hypothetical protein